MMEDREHRYVEDQLERLARDAKAGTFMLEVRELSRETLRRGYPRELLIEDLEEFIGVLRNRGLEDLEDDVMDVLDLLTDWCAPAARL